MSFLVRLEATDSDHQVLTDLCGRAPAEGNHYRECLVGAATEEEAIAFVTGREQSIVDFSLPDEDLETAELAKVLAHHQQKPYRIVSVEEVA